MKGLVMFGALMLASVVSAQTDTWRQGKSDDGTYSYAAVQNADGDIFGEFCTYATRNCFWEMSVATPCEENGTAPILVNTEGGTAALTVTCLGAAKNANFHRYEFNWKELEAVMKGSNTFGLAMGLNGNGFKVYRFTLQGMMAAQRQLETGFFASLPQTKPSARPAAEVL